MAGYFIDGAHLPEGKDDQITSVYIGETAPYIIENNTQSRVLTIQVDGDERAAVLWGLANYKKGEK